MLKVRAKNKGDSDPPLYCRLTGQAAPLREKEGVLCYIFEYTTIYRIPILRFIARWGPFSNHFYLKYNTFFSWGKKLKRKIFVLLSFCADVRNGLRAFGQNTNRSIRAIPVEQFVDCCFDIAAGFEPGSLDLLICEVVTVKIDIRFQAD